MKKSDIKQIISQQLNKLLSLNELKSRQQIRKERLFIHRNINPNNEDFSYLLWDTELSYQDLKKYCQRQQIKKDIEKNKKDYIFDSIIMNHIQLFKLLLEQFKVDVNIHINGQTPLHQACWNNNIQIVKLLLQHPKIDVNIQNENEWTPLHKACYKNRIQIVKLLLKHPKIDVNVKTKGDNTPLHNACYQDNILTVKLLLKHPNIDVNIKNKNGKYLINSTNNNQIKQLIKNHPTYKEIKKEIK